MARYADFDKLKELMKLKKTKTGYCKFIQTGALDLYDYHTGFIDLEIYVYYEPGENAHYVKLWFGTVDDADFGGSLKVGDKEKAEALVHKVAHEVFAHMVVFPTNKVLNNTLRKYGIYVGHIC